MRSFSDKFPMNRQLLFLISASCILFSSPEILLADSSNDLVVAEPQNAAQMVQGQTPTHSMKTANQSSTQQKAKCNPFPTARPVLTNNWGIVFFGDYLYWKLQEGGLAFVLPSPNFTASPPRSQNNPEKGVDGKIVRLAPEFASGVRLGVEFELPRDNWDLIFAWTRYRNFHSRSVTARDDEVLFPFWTNLNFSPIPLRAKAYFHLHFDALELTLGRSLYVGKFLAIRPFAGFQAAWFEQRFKIHYKDVTFRNETTTSILREKNRINTQNYGLMMGMDTKWELGWGLYIQADFAASLLLSDFDIWQHEKNANNTPRSKIKDDFKRVTAMIDMFGGLAWERRFSCNRFYVQLHGGWEDELWFNQNQLNRFVDSSNVGNVFNERGYLSFSGWTFGAKIGF